MGLVTLHRSPAGNAMVGLERQGRGVVARAELRRVPAGLELVSVTFVNDEDAVALLCEIATVATAPAIVTTLTHGWLARHCGFVDGVLTIQAMPDHSAATRAITPADIEAAIVASWDGETSKSWSEANPAGGQCGPTAVTVQELLGGCIVSCNVLRDGKRVERHAWNVLPSGIAVDLTRRQYDHAPGIEFETPVAGPLHEIDDLSHRAAILSRRVRDRLRAD